MTHVARHRQLEGPLAMGKQATQPGRVKGACRLITVQIQLSGQDGNIGVDGLTVADGCCILASGRDVR